MIFLVFEFNILSFVIIIIILIVIGSKSDGLLISVDVCFLNIIFNVVIIFG